jgi:thiamine biosynthesis protein ThiS
MNQKKRCFMQFTINDIYHTADPPFTVQDLVERLAFDPKTIAIERNLSIVPWDQYQTTLIEEGDSMEIVHFIGGG